jgi:hypothetical protein
MFEPKPPIRSTREDEASFAQDIDRFVIGLAERIDSIQDAELAGKSAEVGALARSLANEAERLGYPSMAVTATGVAVVAENDQQDALQGAIIELTEISQRIRRGHRGAA